MSESDPSPLINVGIVLLPDLMVAAQAIFLSKEFASFAEPDPVSGKPQIALSIDPEAMQVPHLSLFHMRVHPERVTGIMWELREHLNLEYRRPIHLALGALEVVSDNWLFWRATRTPELMQLHMDVLEAVADLREGNITDPDAPGLSEDARAAAQAYGFMNAGLKAYDPHVTLGYVRAGTAIKERAEAVLRSNMITVMELGPRGTAVRPFASLHLRGPAPEPI